VGRFEPVAIVELPTAVTGDGDDAMLLEPVEEGEQILLPIMTDAFDGMFSRARDRIMAGFETSSDRSLPITAQVAPPWPD
jgi:hypothetical protein